MGKDLCQPSRVGVQGKATGIHPLAVQDPGVEGPHPGPQLRLVRDLRAEPEIRLTLHLCDASRPAVPFEPVRDVGLRLRRVRDLHCHRAGLHGVDRVALRPLRGGDAQGIPHGRPHVGEVRIHRFRRGVILGLRQHGSDRFLPVEFDLVDELDPQGRTAAPEGFVIHEVLPPLHIADSDLQRIAEELHFKTRRTVAVPDPAPLPVLHWHTADRRY